MIHKKGLATISALALTAGSESDGFLTALEVFRMEIPADLVVLGFGQSRVAKGMMPTAPVPAARQALEAAGVKLEDVGAIKTHNPFAVNDVYFSKQMGIPFESFNNNGSPLVYGHPQGPTGMRVIVEMIEEIAMKGGGYGLFSGCAAGDTAMAAVFKVG